MAVELDSDFEDERAQGLARLASLQRLREELLRDDRRAMLKNIDDLIEAQTRLLRRVPDRERDPG